MAVAFTLFLTLAPELRNNIWRASLPGAIGPSLYFYGEGRYWCSRRLVESDPGYIAGATEMGMDFRTDLLERDNQFQVPLFFVNREARGIALAWCREKVDIYPAYETRPWLTS